MGLFQTRARRSWGHPAASIPRDRSASPKKGPGQGIDPCPVPLIPAARSYERLRSGDQESTSLAIEAGSVLTRIAAWLGPRMPGQAFPRLPPGEWLKAPPLTAIAHKTMSPVCPGPGLGDCSLARRERRAHTSTGVMIRYVCALWLPPPRPRTRLP